MLMFLKVTWLCWWFCKSPNYVDVSVSHLTDYVDDSVSHLTDYVDDSVSHLTDYVNDSVSHIWFC